MYTWVITKPPLGSLGRQRKASGWKAERQTNKAGAREEQRSLADQWVCPDALSASSCPPPCSSSGSRRLLLHSHRLTDSNQSFPTYKSFWLSNRVLLFWVRMCQCRSEQLEDYLRDGWDLHFIYHFIIVASNISTTLKQIMLRGLSKLYLIALLMADKSSTKVFRFSKNH